MSAAFLFDLDQTLIDRTPSLRAFLPRQLRRHRPDATADEVAAFTARFLELDENGYGDKTQLYRALRREFALAPEVDALIEEFRRECYLETFPYPDAVPTLTALRARGARLAIVTNGSAQSQRAKLGPSGLGARVDAVLVSGELGVRKPDPAIFLRATAMLEAEPAACTFVGDNPVADIAGARGVGMRTAWIGRGRSWPPELEAADVVLSDLTDLLDRG